MYLYVRDSLARLSKLIKKIKIFFYDNIFHIINKTKKKLNFKNTVFN